MRILVTGGAGFVGSHLCARLITTGNQVVCIDNFVTGGQHNVAELLDHPAFKLIVADLNQGFPQFEPCDQIYHLASPASPVAYARFPVETLVVNAEATRRLLDLAAGWGSRFLFASTSEIYGDPLVHPQREDYAGNVSTTGPRSVYDEAKRYGEALTAAYGRARGVDVRIARIFNTYGPNMAQDDGRVVSNFIVQALQGKPLTIYGDGLQSRSFQYVDDLIEGLVRLMASNYRDPMNLGNPNENTVSELAETLVRLCGSDSTVNYRPLPQDDPVRRRPDIALAAEVLQWAPQVPLEMGLRRTIDYFRELLGDEASQHQTAVGVHQQ